MANKDGWHIVYGQNVYVEDGKVVLGTTKHEKNTALNERCFRTSLFDMIAK